MPRTEERRVVKITADTRGNRQLKMMAKDMGLLNKNVSSMSKGFGFLRNASIAWFGAMRLGEIVKMSDTMQLLGDRIEVLTDGQADASTTLEQLRDVADSTQTSLSVTADTFSRLAAAIGGAGVKTDDLVALTKVLQDSFLVAGASVKETTSTVVQLAQAFASGEVRGQELRSVMEQNATIARLLRKEYGKDIYKKAASGAITAASVVRILIDNQDELADKAAKIKPTIEKTIVAALNGLRLKLFELNKEFKISTAFAEVLEFAIDKLSLVLVGLAVGAIPFVARAIYTKFLPAIAAATVALVNLALANPFTAIFLGIVSLTVLIVKNLDTLKGRFIQFQAFLGTLVVSVRKLGVSVDKFFGGDKTRIAVEERFIKRLEERLKKLRESGDKLVKDSEKRKIPKISKDLLDFLQKGDVSKLENTISLLNLAFSEGEISAREYFSLLDKAKIKELNDKLKNGKIELQDFNKQLRDFRLANLNREVNAGVVNLELYKVAIDNLKLAELNDKLAQGTINLQEYNKEAAKLRDNFGSALFLGATTYIESIGTLSEEVSKAVSNSFNSLESELVNLAKNRKFEFKKFADGIISDLLRITTRLLIIKPIAESIANLGLGLSLGGTSGGGGGSGGGAGSVSNVATPFAKGGAFDNGVRKFASGGVVSSPTLFNYGSKTGMMGEAGPEAILPLTRSNGKLGVEASVTPVNFTIVNNADTDINTSETIGANGERNIEVVIESKVREGLSKGTYDKQLRSNFGITRRGY